jgi:hypothetical protein
MNVDHLDEACRIWETAIKLQVMEPELCVIKQMESCVSHLLVLRRAMYVEVSITTIEPRKWVARAIVLGKFQLVDSRDRHPHCQGCGGGHFPHQDHDPTQCSRRG